jgi:hypothetical protein
MNHSFAILFDSSDDIVPLTATATAPTTSDVVDTKSAISNDIRVLNDKTNNDDTDGVQAIIDNGDTNDWEWEEDDGNVIKQATTGPSSFSKRSSTSVAIVPVVAMASIAAAASAPASRGSINEGFDDWEHDGDVPPVIDNVDDSLAWLPGLEATSSTLIPNHANPLPAPDFEQFAREYDTHATSNHNDNDNDNDNLGSNEEWYDGGDVNESGSNIAYRTITAFNDPLATNNSNDQLSSSDNDTSSRVDIVRSSGLGSHEYHLDIVVDKDLSKLETPGMYVCCMRLDAFSQLLCWGMIRCEIAWCSIDNSMVFDLLRDCCKNLAKWYSPLVSSQRTHHFILYIRFVYDAIEYRCNQ